MDTENKIETDSLTLQMRFNHEKHTCPMCCLELWNVPPSFFEGEFAENSMFANGSIIAVNPTMCNNCGLKVIH
ncbi:MAG TPA: hypothetical protein VEV83_15015 [Parafilimonas sp.]|jgi:hypothetical protein|nr:hypothetical protein [Parafilimonas sp.]